MKRFALVLFLLPPILLNAQSPFMGDLTPGSNHVGFKTIAVRDSTRTYQATHRPLLISIWYPATTQGVSQVRFEDYLFADAAKTSLNKLDSIEKGEVRAQFIGRMKTRGAAEEDLKRLLDLPTTAFHEVSQDKSTYPLILSLQGGGRPSSTHFILNEYLASHGYIVVSFTDIYASPNRRQNTAVQNMEALGFDIGLAISTIKAQPDLSVSRIGALGFSRAGEAILFHQLKDHNLDAFVAMDAQPGTELVDTFENDRLNKVDLPILAFFSNHQKRMSYAEALSDTAAFGFLPNSDKLKIRMMELNHGDQTSAGMIAGRLVENFNRWPLIGNTKLGHETICRLVLNFFEYQLKQSAAAKTIIDGPISQLNLSEEFLVVHQIKKR